MEVEKKQMSQKTTAIFWGRDGPPGKVTQAI